MKRHYELIVVGAGVAGLAAAHTARAKSVLVIEEGSVVGGRTQSEALPDGQWFNIGAQWVTESVAEMARGLGVDVKLDKLPPPALILKGKRVIETSPPVWFAKLPFAPRARYDFLRLALRLSRELRRREGRSQELERMTLAEWLGPIHPDISGLIDMWASVSGSRDPMKVSALAGLDTIGAVVGKFRFNGAPYHVINGGTGKLAEALAAQLDGAVLTSSAVTEVREIGGQVRVRFQNAEGAGEVTASQCILAIPPHRAAEVFEIPAESKTALDALVPAKAIGAGLIVQGASTAPWDRMYWMRTPGPTMSNLFNPNFFLHERRPPQQQRALSCLCTGVDADRAFGLSDQEVADAIKREFEEVFPEARGKVTIARVQRWDPSYYSHPPGTQAEAHLRSFSTGHVHFCGDSIYSSGIEPAMKSGSEAGARALELLAAPPVSL